jgi:hypothetical protein
MDTGGNENTVASTGHSMCSEGTMTVVVEELSITYHNFYNNDMDYTTSPRPLTITATNQSNGGFTPVLNTGRLAEKEEIQQLTIIAIQHYRLLKNLWRATTTTTHLQMTDMIAKMIRG